MVVTVGSQVSPASTFSYDPPVLEALSPAYFNTSGGIQAFIYGDNFGRDASLLSVKFGDLICAGSTK